VLVILLSVLLLGDDLSGLSALGCVLSMVGSAWYGYVSLSGRQAEALLEAREACGQGQVKEPWGGVGGAWGSNFISG
jgi:hypothetical protein